MLIKETSKKRHPSHLWVLFLFIIGAVLLLDISFLGAKPALTGYASANATIDLCINSPPTLDVSQCNAYAFVGSQYTCVLNVTDPQQTVFGYSIQIISGPAAGASILTLSQDTLSFIANNSEVGNYTLLFTTDDLSNCGITTASQYFNLSINFSSNSPYLIQQIPNKTWASNTLLIAFDLDSYFGDPNNDVLSYQAIGNSHIGITITNGEVMLAPSANWCGNESVIFRATDPTNLSADSNMVLLKVDCPTSSSSGSTSSGGGSGGGGGGSSATVEKHKCVPQFSCFSWSTCQLTRAVSAVNGSSNMVEITGVLGTHKYVIPDEASVDPSVYYEGFSYKDCVDTTMCDYPKTQTLVKSCSYKPSCSDHIQNQQETGVDCGGPCEPCGSCTDGIQNNKEEGVDCGGPTCPACNSCTNGKLDGHELGVDCGGPDCKACPTCFDNIKNQDETGVDCGGQWCKACSEEQFPSATGAIPWVTIGLLALLGLVMLFIFIAAIKRRFAALFLAFAFKHKKRNRTIILATNIKDDILRRLSALERAIDQQPMLKSQEELARIIRDYFKESLHLDFEFTYEELVKVISASKLNPVLGRIMQQFFKRISVIEFSGVAIAPVVLRALIQETRELVYQTAVLTIDDLKQREQDLAIRDIPSDAPNIDKGYLLLSQVHLCLQFKRLEVAAAVYQVLLSWYNQAKPAEQHVIYDDFNRVYEEYLLAKGVTTVKDLPADVSAKK